MNDHDMIHCHAPERQLERAVAIMRRLRAPGGCPWDAEQTHESILTNLLEESYECVEAIRSGDLAHMREELGDVLLQVIFHAELGEEQGSFTLSDIAKELSDKLVRRHPHVFGDSHASGTAAVLSQWDAIKATEKGQSKARPYLHGCGEGLPSLMRARKLSERVARIGFDWPDSAGACAKVQEELDEVSECLQTEPLDKAHLEEELGDLLFTVVNLCRSCHIDPEIAMNAANEKFIRRFNALEEQLSARDIPLREASFEQLEEAWQSVKKQQAQ